MELPTQRRTRIILCCVAAALILLALLVFFSDKLFPKDTGERVRGEAVIINGEKYAERKLETMLLVGIDAEGAITSNHSYNNPAQADFLALIAVDRATSSYTVLHINRDSMVEIDELGIDGQRTGALVTAQIALAHTWGDGTSNSGMNTRRAVSRLLYGLTVDHYAVVSMDGIKALNDYIGGVTLTVPEDYPQLDPAFVKGAELTLNGNQALAFVRARGSVDDGTNLARMERQKLYMEAFCSKMQGLTIDESFVKGAWKEIVDPGYTETDCTLNSAESFLKDLSGCSFDGIFSLEGTAVAGDPFIEFNIDRDALATLATALYFNKK